jgi:hypothetical protein
MALAAIDIGTKFFPNRWAFALGRGLAGADAQMHCLKESGAMLPSGGVTVK